MVEAQWKSVDAQIRATPRPIKACPRLHARPRRKGGGGCPHPVCTGRGEIHVRFVRGGWRSTSSLYGAGGDPRPVRTGRTLRSSSTSSSLSASPKLRITCAPAPRAPRSAPGIRPPPSALDGASLGGVAAEDQEGRGTVWNSAVEMVPDESLSKARKASMTWEGGAVTTVRGREEDGSVSVCVCVCACMHACKHTLSHTHQSARSSRSTCTHFSKPRLVPPWALPRDFCCHTPGPQPSPSTCACATRVAKVTPTVSRVRDSLIVTHRQTALIRCRTVTSTNSYDGPEG